MDKYPSKPVPSSLTKQILKRTPGTYSARQGWIPKSCIQTAWTGMPYSRNNTGFAVERKRIGTCWHGQPKNTNPNAKHVWKWLDHIPSESSSNCAGGKPRLDPQKKPKRKAKFRPFWRKIPVFQGELEGPTLAQISPCRAFQHQRPQGP